MLMPSVLGRDLFDDFFGFPFFDDKDLKHTEKKLYGRKGKNLMKTDVRETADSYILEMDLPGFKKEEVSVALEEGYLTVSAAKGLDQEEKDKKTGAYIRRERYAGACQRSFYVGEDVEQEAIRAKFDRGILTLTVPKAEEKPAEEEKKFISIEG